MAANDLGATGASFSEGLPPHILRIYKEYLEMPGLRLTRAQAQRLWGLESTVCNEALDYLVAAQFLCCTTSGQYARLTDGAFPLTPSRMAKAELPQTPPARLRA